MRRFSVVVMLLFAGVVWGLAASGPALDDSASKEVLAVETARTTALDNSDVAALEKILADDLTDVHASGKVDTKGSLLEAIRSGEVHYIS